MARIMPKLGLIGSEYEMMEGASKLNYRFDEVKVIHEIHNGSSKFYHRGYKFRATLTFTGVTITQYNGLKDEFDRHTELNFIPNPQDYPATNFEVRWLNDWSFIYAYTVRTDRYAGTIELEGTAILLTVPDWV